MHSEIASTGHFFEKIPLLSNNRLVLQEIAPADIRSIVDISVYDGLFAENVTQASRILERINADIRNGKSIHWGIYLKETHAIVGTCGFYRGFAGNIGEIGYLLLPSFRGRGIMAEAVELMLAFGFDRLRLASIIAYVHPKNRSSIAVLQRAGFHRVNSLNTDLKFEIKSSKFTH